ncbi:MAG TPA: enoyl-CoA hydratase-related protein [Thermoanaerobaculia bacterium]|jgi:methylglutaconyl-CoA hydratase|nr:enoyl-CoA hydratase-related protein [Thermoanaerobaculia bacterium]
MSEGTYERLIIRRDRDLLWVTLNDPDRANALSPAMIEELTSLYRTPLRAEGIRAVILAGAGKNFSAGADLEHLRSLRDVGEDENLRDSLRLRDLFESVLRQEALTITLVHGACVAGGCGLATAHDFVVAADDSRFLYSEVRIGFVAALVATYLPLRLKGSDIRELLLFPRFVEAGKALEIGLVNRVCPAEDLARVGEALAGEVLETASSESIARTKRLLLDVIGRPLDQALLHAAGVNAASRSTADCKHGIATFLETKKPPRWRE